MVEQKSIEELNAERQKQMEEMLKQQKGNSRGNVYLNEVATGPAKPLKVED